MLLGMFGGRGGAGGPSAEDGDQQCCNKYVSQEAIERSSMLMQTAEAAGVPGALMRDGSLSAGSRKGGDKGRLARPCLIPWHND